MPIKSTLLIGLFCLISKVVFAQQPEVIYLKNGSIIKCTVLEQVFGESVKIKTSDGSIFVFKTDEVLKIEKAGQKQEGGEVAQDGLPKDADGNEYDFVTIGDQVWLTDNIRTTKLNDGRKLTLRNENTWWAGLLGTYDNMPKDEDAASRTFVYCTYGASYMYGYGAAFSGEICPKGWHVPTVDEYRKLISYPHHHVYSNDPGQKASGMWIGPDAMTATAAAPGAALFFPGCGYRDRHNNSGAISHVGLGYYWAQSTTVKAGRLWLGLDDDDDSAFVSFDEYTLVYTNYSAMPVRCIKD